MSGALHALRVRTVRDVPGVGQWFQRGALGLSIVAAETHPLAPLRRITYEPVDGASSVDGVDAVARALEHLHLGWAMLGFLFRMPIVYRSPSFWQTRPEARPGRSQRRRPPTPCTIYRACERRGRALPDAMFGRGTRDAVNGRMRHRHQCRERSCSPTHWRVHVAGCRSSWCPALSRFLRRRTLPAVGVDVDARRIDLRRLQVADVAANRGRGRAVVEARRLLTGMAGDGRSRFSQFRFAARPRGWRVGVCGGKARAWNRAVLRTGQSSGRSRCLRRRVGRHDRDRATSRCSGACDSSCKASSMSGNT